MDSYQHCLPIYWDLHLHCSRSQQPHAPSCGSNTSRFRNQEYARELRKRSASGVCGWRVPEYYYPLPRHSQHTTSTYRLLVIREPVLRVGRKDIPKALQMAAELSSHKAGRLESAITIK
eukprot:scpid90523/ scgid33935/ 